MSPFCLLLHCYCKYISCSSIMYCRSLETSTCVFCCSCSSSESTSSRTRSTLICLVHYGTRIVLSARVNQKSLTFVHIVRRHAIVNYYQFLEQLLRQPNLATFGTLYDERRFLVATHFCHRVFEKLFCVTENSGALR